MCLDTILYTRMNRKFANAMNIYIHVTDVVDVIVVTKEERERETG